MCDGSLVELLVGFPVIDISELFEEYFRPLLISSGMLTIFVIALPFFAHFSFRSVKLFHK